MYNKLMVKLIDIISPIYQELLEKCARRKISVNLDFQNLHTPIDDEEAVRKFFATEIKRPFKMCDPGDKITISQSTTADGKNRLSVKNSSKETLDSATVEKLREQGYEIRARFGYDTIIAYVI